MTETLAVPDAAAKPRYAEAFLTERPKDGLDIVQARLKKAKVLNDELAEYFKERAHAEDQYAKSLARLSKKVFVIDKSTLGTFTPVYDLLVNEVNDMATAHSVMANKIIEEVEKPLRSRMANDLDYSRIRAMEPNMQKHIKDYDERFAKVMKHKKTADKAGNAKKHEFAGAKLTESHKVMEEVRVAWHREGPEILEKHQAVDENRLQALKDLVTRFENIQSEQMLKRIEVADSTLSAAIAFDVQAEIESFCSAKNILMTRMLKAHSDLEAPPRDVGLVRQAFGSMRRRPKTETGWMGGESARSDNAGEFQHDFFGFENPPPVNDSGFTFPDLAIPTNVSGISATNSHDESNGHPAPGSPTSVYSSNSMALKQQQGAVQNPRVLVDAEGYTIPPERPPWVDVASGSQISGEIPGEDDSDGGSVFGNQRMRVEIKEQAVTEESEEVSSALSRVVTVLRSKDTLVNKPRGRRGNNRSTQLFNNPPNFELYQQNGRLSPSSESAQNISVPSSPVSFDFTHRRTSSTSENNPSNPFSSSTPQNPFEQPTTLISDEVTMEPLTVQEGETRPQLKAFISENISVLTKTGQVARTFITGEISLTYNGPSEPSTSTPFCFRISNLDALEKIVPNTSYINPLDDHPGIYILDANMFSLAGGIPVVVLKYQAHIDPDDVSRVVPLIVQPLWRCEENQTLLVLRYQANHDVQFMGEDDAAEAVLSGLTFLVPVDGDVTGAQSEPAGAWSPERKKMLWNVRDIAIPSGGGEDGGEVNKLLAKFETATIGTPQAVAVKFTCKGRLLSGVGVMGVRRAELEDATGAGMNGVKGGEELVVEVVGVERVVSSHKYVAGP